MLTDSPTPSGAHSVLRSTPRGLVVSGESTVPHSRETAMRLLLRAFVAGGVVPGLRIVRRDGRGIAFEAVSIGALSAGPTHGELAVVAQGGETRAVYRFSYLGAMLFAVVPALGGGLLTHMAVAVLSGDAFWAHGVVPGSAYAALWVVWAVRRTRHRFDTLLHNLRYVS